MRKITMILALVLLTIFLGCRERIEPEADDFVEYAWTLYAERDFRSAHAEFQEGLDMDSLYIDGYNGSGWCFVEFNSPDTAITYFSEGLDYLTVDSSQVRFEMLAGLALSYQVIGDYSRAITRATELYTFRPVFEFSHDWRINYSDIIILLAASQYAQSNFSAALTWVQKLDETFSVDVSTYKGRADLIKKIEALQNI